MKVYCYPDEMLSTICSEVTAFDENLHKILDDMKETMLAENGIGLAANQVGYALRMFVMLDKDQGIVHSIINPKILSSASMVLMDEGCLSAPGVFLRIPRYKWLNVEYQDQDGAYWTSELDGIDAVCFQHELDHLNGIFFLDKGNRQDRRKAAKILKLKR